MPWSSNPTVYLFSTLTVKVALLYSFRKVSHLDVSIHISEVLDFISELYDSLDRIHPQRSDVSPRKQDETQLVKSFLWSTWSRCLQLHFWYILLQQVIMFSGYQPEWDSQLALRGISALSDQTFRRSSESTEQQLHPYMCRWAFGLLRNSRVALGLDFRHFNRRFSELHGRKESRCNFMSSEACTGQDPLHCGRFNDRRLIAGDQSVHVDHEGDCKRIMWNERSYHSVKGPVAVSFSTTYSGYAKYVKASSRTMAISHVWSHGHGGRPSTGMNKCLHKRFKRVAKKLGCKSYWIDTLCIPEDHLSRRIAIGHINKIFTTSDVTLILDKDIMNVDISSPSIEIHESLLAMFLVCDWNVRAWTVFEAVMGRHALHLLCKDERTISLGTLVATVNNLGRLELSTLFLATPLILASTKSFDRTKQGASLEVAASILSNRHATREGDEIVIWSLLIGMTPCFSAEEFWLSLSKNNHPIKTGMLMSKVRRLEDIPGFSWAPKSPYARPHTPFSRDHPAFSARGTWNLSTWNVFHVFDGGGSTEALITPRGLQGAWCVYHFTEDAERYRFDAETTLISNEGSRYFPENPCWSRALQISKQFANADENCSARVILIQPKGLSLNNTRWRGASGRGGDHGELFALCVSMTQHNFMKHDSGWTWITVQPWLEGLPMPSLQLEEILIV